MHKPLSPEATILLRAADWLEEHDWCQGPLWLKSNGEPAHVPSEVAAACAYGACKLVTTHDDLSLRKTTNNPNFFPPIIQFSEADGRTKEEVIAWLRQRALSY